MKDRINNILILAGDTDGNIGDRAIVFSMCEELRKINPDINISLLSNNLIRDLKYFRARPIPRGIWGLPSLIKVAKASDLILCGGGGLFQDDDSLVKMPYWALRLSFIRLFCKRIIGYSLGVGPLKKPSSRFFARLAFCNLDCISVRDHNAEKTVKSLTSKPIHIVPDPALLLPSESRDAARKLLVKENIPLDGTPLIGVALRRWFHQNSSPIPHKYAVKYGLRRIPGKERCSKLTSLLAKVFDGLILEHNAYIVFMPSYNVSHEADHQICQEVIDKMNNHKASMVSIYNPKLYKAVAVYLTVMLGGRMHPTILAAAAGTPIVGLAYNHKFSGFFSLLGLEDKVMHVEDFVYNELSDELSSLLSIAMTKDKRALTRVNELAKKIHLFNERIFLQPAHNSV